MSVPPGKYSVLAATDGSATVLDGPDAGRRIPQFFAGLVPGDKVAVVNPDRSGGGHEPMYVAAARAGAAMARAKEKRARKAAKRMKETR